MVNKTGDYCFELLPDKPGNAEVFDAFVATHPKGHVLQSWEWGYVKEPAWLPLRLVARRADAGESEICGAALILQRSLPAGLGQIFYSPRGPVLDINDAGLWQAFVAEIRRLGKERGAIYWKVDPDVDIDDPAAALWRERLLGSGFSLVDKGEGFEGIQPRFVFRLDIRPEVEELLAACHQKTRYNIRLAGRKGVEIVRGAGRDALPEFYRILTTTASRDNFLIRPYSYFEGFYDRLHPVGQTELFMAYYEGEAIAGTLAFRMGEKAWYIYGASANSHRNLMPNYLIQWTMIEWAKEQGCTMYDFRGVPGHVPEDHPLYGLVKFKKGFGGKYTEFIGEYDLVLNSGKYKLYNVLEPLYQKNVRRLIALKKKLRGQK